jgi:hypothetical protein
MTSDPEGLSITPGRWRPWHYLLVGLALIAAYAAGTQVGNTHDESVPRPAATTASLQPGESVLENAQRIKYARFRLATSFLGELSAIRLEEGVTYYLPGTFQLIKSGNSWLITDLWAPVLTTAKDAAPYPYTLKVTGLGLQLKLPSRTGFYFRPPEWANPITGSGWQYQPAIVVTSVIPAS